MSGDDAAVTGTDGGVVAGVELRFTPVAPHVRTVRLVVAAAARRAGFEDENRLDGLRLAVGEACARAVRRCSAAGICEPILVRVDDSGPALVVEVVDAAGPDAGHDEDPVVLALLEGLADAVELAAGVGGPNGRVRLSWLSE